MFELAAVVVADAAETVAVVAAAIAVAETVSDAAAAIALAETVFVVEAAAIAAFVIVSAL